MRVDDFDYTLPAELIAQKPTRSRTASRLLLVDRQNKSLLHRRFLDLGDYLRAGDCLVMNETRVRPARLMGRKKSGAALELLLLREVEPDVWEALCRPAKRLSVGAVVEFADGLRATVLAEKPYGARLLHFTGPSSVSAVIARRGLIALPPYIHEKLGNPERYQTVFAKKPGSVAAPTAGLHFTETFLKKLAGKGVRTAGITLDIGLDTFRPIQVSELESHKMHSESYEIPETTAANIQSTRRAGGRIVAVGTTVVRALESAAVDDYTVAAGLGSTHLFIKPGYKFKIVDALLTNFHLPRSTLIVLVSAFAGRELVLKAYGEAVRAEYRFYSFGDAMLII